MTDFYLRAESREELEDALESVGLIGEDGRPIVATHSFALDIIGMIYEPTGETFVDEETGEEFPVMQAVEGYHANVRAETLPESLQQFAIPAPSAPVRVWA